MQTMTAPAQVQQPAYEISDSDRERVQRIAQAWDAYNGNLVEPLKKLPESPNDNVLSNRCQPIVDRGIDFLFGKELEISCEEGAPQEAQDFLDATWGRKETRIPLLQKLAMSGAIAGQAFLRIVPSVDKTFRLIVVDPATVYVRTAPQDCETVLLYCIEYASDQKIEGRPQRVYYREEITRINPDANSGEQYADTDASGIDPDDTWSIAHWTKIGDRGQWIPAGEPIIWPYPFAPLFSCQNLPKPSDFWGIPDLTPDLIGVNNALNLVQSNINRIIKLYGSPIIYSTGVGDTVIDIKPGKIIGLPLPESKIVAVTLQSDLANALQFAMNLRSDIDEQSSVPGVATGRIVDLPRGTMSAVALELLFMPLLLKMNKKRCGYGSLILDVSKALLALNNMSGDIEMTIAWVDPLPHDDLTAMQAAILKQQIGVSTRTLLEELGMDADEEEERNQEEAAQKMTNFAQGRGMPPPMDMNAQPQPQDQGNQPFGGQ
jgi:hypothetical protein